MSQINDLRGLFLHTLKDIYYAEQQVKKLMPEMAEKATNQELKDAIGGHLNQAQTHIGRLEKVFEAIGEKAEGVTCQAMDGIVKECRELMDEVEDAETRDAAIISSAQAVDHYEITRYGTLATWAEQLGLDGDTVDHLRDSLGEEEESDEKLTRLAEDKLNQKAV